jgi:amino acid adenylation domain-containing protein/thioester reductase-like protein
MQSLLAALKRLGIKLHLNGDELQITAPAGTLTNELKQSLRTHKAALIALLKSRESAESVAAPFLTDAANRNAPFALTEMQHAYWLGRDSSLDMGNVATHLYAEFDCPALDMGRLNDALCTMIRRHDMLRAVIGPDGMQRILPEVPAYRIEAVDATSASAAQAEAEVERVRAVLSHQVLRADTWPLFDIRATRLPGHRLRLHVSLDLLILDAWSIFIFFQEWRRIYDGEASALAPIDMSFRDYVLADQAAMQGERYRQSYAYWMDKVDNLPAAPVLPLRADPGARRAPRFSRRESRLDKARWAPLKSRARDVGLTPSGLLLALYAEVLARWSGSQAFTLNLTVGSRRQVHPHVNHLLGDFTSLILQQVDRQGDASFLDFALALQRDFLQNLDHAQVSGVTVLREWARRHGASMQAAMPVVFSSGLIWNGDVEVGDLEQFGRKVYSVSQTSQVWLDHHVMELQGDLVFIWDAADAVFEDGVLDDMFAAYCGLIDTLAADDGFWRRASSVALPERTRRLRGAVNETHAATPDERLHAGFIRQARHAPDRTAVIAAERNLSYGELLAESAAVADWLLDEGVASAEPVAVVMRKGWEQIVAVLGTLMAGAAYLPVDADLPAKRQADLLAIGGVRHVLTQPDVLRAELAQGPWSVRAVRAGGGAPFTARHEASLDAPRDELAYVIFTSGTTGVPKGVMIDHAGAVNTVFHVNRLFGVDAGDRVLAVSSLSFDLSVYDIFGLLACGGALVIPDYRLGHDPVHWRDLLQRHGVTVWNSAPQLMRMLMDSCLPGDGDTALLRTVLLSGDFIPLDLPARIRARHADARVIGLGGATEASIWSIFYEVDAVSPDWRSIPYGKPLPNQTIHVLDGALAACPDHVAGRIHIGGTGLALGYWRDEVKTAAKFITHPHSGERLYDTGDLGRYLPDGNVVILGRSDGQIKIRGHRVELGEIESVLRQHPAVRYAVVVAGGGEHRRLTAYVEPQAGAVDPAGLKAFLGERLPDYMVPRHIALLDKLPVSGNGKIDYKALPAVEETGDTASNRVLARNEAEQAILDVWSRVIPGVAFGVTDNFFELGGDSLLATQLVRELNAALPFGLEMHELFENLTIEALARLYAARQEAGAPAPERQDGLDDSVLRADLEAALAELDDMPPFAAPDGFNPAPRAVFVTGATGWIGAHLLPELLRQTEATIWCAVRADDKAHALERVMQAMAATGIVPDPLWRARIECVCADLTHPRLGIADDAWASLCTGVDAVYHLAATVNVTLDYPTHHSTNVVSALDVIRLATSGRVKPVYFTSPLAISRRRIDGELVVLPEERTHAESRGLLTAYAQSKWAAEQLLSRAAERGLPLKIYRTSHALPSSHHGKTKPHDTYGAVLRAACTAGAVPEWKEATLGGLPVDVLAALIVENSLVADDHHGVVHLENADAPRIDEVIASMLGARHRAPARVPLDEWRSLCLAAADSLPPDQATLVRLLFTPRGDRAAVDNMFTGHAFDAHYFDRRRQRARLAGHVLPDYWRKVARNAPWWQH